MSEKLFPNEIILLTKHFDVHQNWDLPVPALFIVASKDETMKSIGEFNKEEARELGETIRKVRMGMKEALGIKDVYLFQNEDSEYGFHVWMFPRYPWMERFGRKIQSVRSIMDYAEQQMINEENIKEVKAAAAKMRAYFKQSQYKSHGKEMRTPPRI